MNNKGFAITTILYGVLIIFCLLLVSMLGILSTYRGNLEKLMTHTNGARDIIKSKREEAGENTPNGDETDMTLESDLDLVLKPDLTK